MIQIGAAQYAAVHMDAPARRQQPHERAAQRAAVGRADMPAAMREDIGLELFGFLEHRGEDRVLRFVKAVVADAEPMKILLKERNDRAEIAPPVAERAGQQQHGGESNPMGALSYFNAARQWTSAPRMSRCRG